MKNALVAIVVGIGYVVAGCATKYQAQGLTGGFSETQLDVNVFRVTFRGNAYTPGERASDMVLLRSAELGLKHGFTHFALVDSQTTHDYSAFTTPSQTTTTATVNSYGNTAYGTANSTTYGGDTIIMKKPSATNTVVYFKSRPNVQGMIYDAAFLCASLGKKFEVACGLN